MDSDQVFTALEGKEEVAGYLTKKLANVKEGCIEMPVAAVLTPSQPWPGPP